MITIAARGRSSEAMKLRSTTNHSAGTNPHIAARTNGSAAAISAGSWRSSRSNGAMCHSNVIASKPSARATHRPCRTVRRGPRTA